MATALIDTAASGDVTIQAAPAAGRLIRVQGYVMLGAGSDTVYLAAGADSVKLTGSMVLSAQAGAVAPCFDQGWFDLPQATALIINKAAAVQLGGHVRFELVG